jgi:adenosylcobinamide-GDP ribazoletransferase
MTLAPVVGLVLAAVAAVVLTALDGRSTMLAATAAVALLALLTRGIHLDGLADTADGLGSGRTGEQGLEVMRKSDIGPFGVVVLVLGLLLQVAALTASTSDGQGVRALTIAVVVSRLVIPLLCTPIVRPARADGLGSAVAGSVRGAGIAVAVLVAAIAVALTGLLDADHPGRRATLVQSDVGASPDLVLGVLAFAIPLIVAGLLCWRCVTRFGGITGDVLGACVEVAFTAALVVAAVYL